MKRLLRAALIATGLLACSPPIYCVARGSRVRVPRGTRNIEEIGVGDEVICVDPVTGAQHTGRVTAVRSAHRECIRLDVGSVQLTVTSDHPVWSPEGSGYFPAGDWAMGTRRALALSEGEQLTTALVHHVERYVGIHQVFDLTVDHPLHNFVAEGVLVHNKPPACDPRPDGGALGDPCGCSDGGQGTLQCGPGVVSCSCD